MSDRPNRPPGNRAQAAVVGVAILLAVTVVSMGLLTAAIGEVVSSHAAAADADRVAADFDRALAPEVATGARSATVRFAEGELAVVPRELRVTVDGSVVRTIDVGGLVFANGEHRVAAVAGLLVRGKPGRARVTDGPLVTADDGVVVVGAARLGASPRTVAGTAGRVRLATNVTHERIDLGPGTIGLAIETATPDAVAEALAAAGATVVSRDRDYDGDGVPSVVVRFPGDRRGWFVRHDLHLEVGDG